MKKHIEWTILAALTVTSTACGGGKDEEESKGPSGSLSELSQAIESPTGTVSEETAADVARAYEDSIGVPTSGEREGQRVAEAAVTEVACGVSGNISVDADASGEFSSYNYNSCCQTAGCCLDGGATIFVDTTGSAAYSACADYDVDYDCEGVQASYSFQYCVSTSGTGIIYAINVEGETFAVTGSVANGTGSLTISGENGTWTCEYTSYTGTCTSDAGESFSF